MTAGLVTLTLIGQTTSRQVEPVTLTIHTDAVDAEMARRKRILWELQQKFIVVGNNKTPEQYLGFDPPPFDWLNRELAQRGETWTVDEEIMERPATPRPKITP